jgi:HKD family nuclease
MKSQFEVKGLLGSGSAFVVGLPDPFHLKQELQSAKSIKLATAFAHWSGWRHLLPHVKKTAGTVKLLTGLSFCQTEPRVLYDWCERSQEGRVEARLFTQKQTTFHPKVLLVENSRRAFAVVGSGNLSNGGFLQNIECGLYSDDENVYSTLDAWFERLFSDNSLTKQLREPDIRHYKKRFDAAKNANKEVKELQKEAEDEIGEQHRAGLGNWKQAVRLAKKFFTSRRFLRYYEPKRAATAKEIKYSLRYPKFDFDEDGLEDYYKIQALGHLIEVRKPRVWAQRKKLQAGLRHLVDDSAPIEARLHAVLAGRYKVEGVGLNFLTKILAVHDPLKFTVFNQPIAQALEHFKYERTRGYSPAQRYLEFADLMRRFLKESGGRSSLDLDNFFYEYWDKHLKKKKKRGGR